MATYKTPGVFIEEISTLGSSIAGVPTAIPGFVGYTEKAIIDGVQWTYPTAVFAGGEPAPPVRITSLLEYQQIFGGPLNEKFEVTLTGTVPSPTIISIVPKTISASNRLSSYILFYQVQMFYANGGGTCYIVSVGDYSNTLGTITSVDLVAGIDKFEQVDEVTLLVAPEAVFLQTIGDRRTVYNRMSAQCAKMQDRFAIVDTVHNGNSTIIGNNTIFQDATDFRSNDIGADNLKYVGAYYPALNTPIVYSFTNDNIAINDIRTIGALPYNYRYDTVPNKTLSAILNGSFSSSSNISILSTLFAGDNFKVNIAISGPANDIIMVAASPPDPNDPNEFDPGATEFDSVTNLVLAINAHPDLSGFITAVETSTLAVASFKLTAKQQGAIGNYAFAGNPAARYSLPSGNLSGGVPSDKALYNNIISELSKYTLTLYPSAAMAGIYARVDADRGVWKAPANVGFALVNEPSIQITDDDQENLNVDSVSGKSINAIRVFTGRGTLVWGARTLAGNDNEWRYINVRRLFIYVEESVKKATEFVVFESNTANTWQRVQGMIEAFLTGLWRDGALAGATPKDAFFVRVGLGTTMTAQDILEGKMIVEIGMAAARPAEFIILRFSHKLQES
ncbi:MAG: phage tail sheath family protein [Bacteroidetes bacterium]|nr:phage tail sheath family protein [Bacteroidota bacterium]